MSKKLGIEEMHKLAKKRGGICLSKTYVNNHTKLLWECKCDHQWKATPKNIRRGAWCHICGGSIKLTIDDMRQIALKRGGKCLSNNYINNQTKLLWECAGGHKWKAIPSSVKSGCWCPKCAKKRTSQALRLDINALQILAKRRRGRCLSSTYVNAHTKLLWECKHGHRWEATPNGIQQGGWCPLCAGHGKTIKDMKQIAEQRGGKCLSNVYVNTETKILWECSEGHQWKATPDKIKRGEWCPQCSSGLGERICREFLSKFSRKHFLKSIQGG